MKPFIRLSVIAALALSCISFPLKGQITNKQGTYVKLSCSADWRYLPGNISSTPTFGLGTGIDLILLDRLVLGAAFDISARYERNYGYGYGYRPQPERPSPYWFYFLSGRAGYRIPLDTSVDIDLTPHVGAGLYMEPGMEQGDSYNSMLVYAGIESDIRLFTHTALKARLQIIATPDGRIGYNTGIGLSFLL